MGDYNASLAVDGDESSCYMSGYSFKEWLLVDLGSPRTVQGVVFKGGKIVGFFGLFYRVSRVFESIEGFRGC